MHERPLLVRSFAKINLALSVLGRRSDGYHDIQTVFQTVDLCDELEIRPAAKLELVCENLPDVSRDENLIWKAANMVASFVAAKHGASIVLKKRIPAGAGLGGGSSNAAATLLGLLKLWQIRLSHSNLQSLAAALGSDVPFFLNGGTALGSGRGEIIMPLTDFPRQHLVIIFPGVRISTAEAYRSLNLGLTSINADHRIEFFCNQVQEGKIFLTEIFNDFEASILLAHPPVLEAKRFLRDRGAIAAMLSGSGSAVFGFFSNEESALAASRAALRDAWRVFPAKTLSRAEYLQKMFG